MSIRFLQFKEIYQVLLVLHETSIKMEHANIARQTELEKRKMILWSLTTDNEIGKPEWTVITKQ